MGSTAVVEQLREKIRKLEAQPRELVMGLRSGFPELDALGVFRLGSGVELCGEEASGRTTVALSVVAAAGREKRLSAWVDGPSELYPPAAMARGVDLQRLLIARPKSSGQLVWTAMQLLRSGVFVCVVLDVMHTGLRLTMTDAKKLLDAARTGGSLLVLLTSQSAPAQGFGRLMFSLSLRERGEGRGEGPDLEPSAPPPRCRERGTPSFQVRDAPRQARCPQRSSSAWPRHPCPVEAARAPPGARAPIPAETEEERAARRVPHRVDAPS
jgi:hypothetical protein